MKSIILHLAFIVGIAWSGASGLSAQDSPQSFTSTAISPSQVDLDFTKNAAGDSIIIAFSTDGVFGSPTGIYTLGDPIIGGGTVIYLDNGTSFSHSSLNANTQYYYKAWSWDQHAYSAGLSDDDKTYKWEPTYHPTSFASGTTTSSAITLTWTDAVGSVLPDGYLIKASTLSYGDISDPVDGTAEANSASVQNVGYGVESVTFSSLNGNTTYYFKIYPYTNSGSHIDYKLDPTIPVHQKPLILFLLKLVLAIIPFLKEVKVQVKYM